MEGGPHGLRQRGLGPTYYFERQWRGKRIKLSLGSSLPQARLKAQEVVNAIDRGDFSEARFRQDKIGVAVFFEDALKTLEARSNLGPKSIASYRGRIDQFLKYLAESHPAIDRLAEVTPSIAHGFVEWRRRQKVSRSGKMTPTTPRNHPAAQTVHDDVRRLRTMFRVAVDKQQLSANPFAAIKVPRKASDVQAPPRPLSEIQVKRLLKAATEYDQEPEGVGGRSTFRGMFHDILLFYLLTGLRKDELIHLSWKKVEFDWGQHGRIHIEPIDEPVDLWIRPNPQQAGRLTKHALSLDRNDPLFRNRQQIESMVALNYADQELAALLMLKPRAWDAQAGILRVPTRIVWKQKATRGSVPLVPASRAILKRRERANSADSPFCFPHPDRGPLRSDPLPQFKQVLAHAGLPSNIRLHDTRHTFGFTLRRRGVPLETLMGLMRHASIEETMVYASYSDEEGAAGIQRLQGFGS